MKKIITFFILTLFVISCSKEAESVADPCDAEISTLNTSLTNASSELSTNPTQTNCTAFKTAWITLYNKLKACGKSTAELDATRATTYESIDCSVFGGGNGGGSGDGGTTGNVTFWVNQSIGSNYITVNCNGQSRTISNSISTNSPTCNMTSSANFSLPAGTYSFTASNALFNWSGNISITGNGSCLTQQLTFSGGGNGGGGSGGGTTGNQIVWSQIDHGCGPINVTINGTSRQITSYYSGGSSSLNCGASGCANFTLNAGTYSVVASCSSKNWSGTCTVTAGGCSSLRLD